MLTTMSPVRRPKAPAAAPPPPVAALDRPARPAAQHAVHLLCPQADLTTAPDAGGDRVEERVRQLLLARVDLRAREPRPQGADPAGDVEADPARGDDALLGGERGHPPHREAVA